MTVPSVAIKYFCCSKVNSRRNKGVLTDPCEDCHVEEDR